MITHRNGGPGVKNRRPVIWYGADYNPEQWPESLWAEDIQIMEKAGMNTATIGVFSWAKLQPGHDRWEFGWLDRVIENLDRGGVHIILATPTASPPPWMCRLHPDILPIDKQGHVHSQGGRGHYCPNSPSYRVAAGEVAVRLAERYGRHPALVLWHVHNEYGGECYCDHCARAFRRWLQKRHGTLDAVNAAWNTAFWSQTYYDWEEILPPRQAGAFNNNGQVLDYRRFISDSYLQCYLDQREAIRPLSPDVPATTNFMGWFRGLDYWQWAPHLNVISWDSYPPQDAPPWLSAAWHDLMRSLKRQPFLLLEQSPSQVNWMPCNRPRQPGEVALMSVQALAHGADALCYFQFRQSAGGPEQFHAGVVPHAGIKQSRVFAEVAGLGRILKHLGSATVGSTTRADVAVVFDWDSWWASEQEPTITNEFQYLEEIQRYYRALWSRNIAVDFVHPTGPLEGYSLVIAPALRVVTPKIAEVFERFVDEGGTFVGTFGTGLTDDNDRAHTGGYPGPLRCLFGIWIEEFDPLCGPGSEQANGDHGSFQCFRWCDALNLVEAHAMARFTTGFCAGRPAITEQVFGKGRAIYIGTAPEDDALEGLLGRECARLQIRAPLEAPRGVEVMQRWTQDGPQTWLLNHNEDSTTIRLHQRMIDLLTDQELEGDLALQRGEAMLLIPRAAGL
jgi:beta-galactosidase